MALSVRRRWLASNLLSLALAAALVLLWSQMNRYDVDRGQQLVNEEAAARYLDEIRASDPTGSAAAEPMRRIRTGIFIQSLKFFNAAEVNVSGYLWQHYRDGLDDDLRPGRGEVGYIFPERVDSGQFLDTEAYRHKTKDGEVIGWYFEATIRQPFDYRLYPFDHKTVWIRMWHREFSRNVVLVPDFAAYAATGVDDIFGIEDSIVLGTWERRDTYFDYRLSDYDTNFGISDYVGRERFPELHYNVVIQRKFENAFIVNLFPLLLVAALLFGLLLTISDEPDIAGRHGTNTSGMIGACSALLFVVLLAHIHLREQFAVSGVVYLEYFYIVMYAALAASAAYAYLFAQGALRGLPFGWLRDPLYVKLAYWPLLLMSLVAVTALTMLQ